MHEGSIQAHSAGLGQGSAFTVSLPLATAPRRDVPGQAQAELFGHRLKVLVVDDNQDSADSLALLLKTQGHEVSTAYDGSRGLSVCERLRPDAVILDILMPGMDGFELARRIRDAHWGREMLLVALSGLGREHDPRGRHTPMIDAHLTKPAQPSQLFRLLDERGRLLAGQA
jgi:CheY-like chemotaxis protein